MRLAVIYSDQRGKYLADGFRAFCDVVEIDLSGLTFTLAQKMLSAAVSFHFNRSDWVNDFHRNPIAVFSKKHNGNKILYSLSEKVDAVFQFGVMNTYDYSLLGTTKVFYYQDGAYDKNSKLWIAKRFNNSFAHMQKRAFDNATAIFTFSNWARQQHINDYMQDEKKVFAVGWGPCLPVEHDDIELKKQVTKLLFIGRSGKWKGLHVLFSAFKNIRNDFPDIRLDIIGVSAQDALEIAGEGIFFHGRIPQEGVIDFLQRSDLFILPSLYERSAHVIVEAMWYGCPVIVSRTCGSPEPVLAANCGLVVEPGNVEALQHAILTIMEYPENIPKLSRNAMLEARGNWSWKAVCETMVNHMKTTINSGR